MKYLIKNQVNKAVVFFNCFIVSVACRADNPFPNLGGYDDLSNGKKTYLQWFLEIFSNVAAIIMFVGGTVLLVECVKTVYMGLQKSREKDGSLADLTGSILQAVLAGLAGMGFLYLGWVIKLNMVPKE